MLKRVGTAFAFCVLCTSASFAQTSPNASSPPSPLRGFVPPYEILRTLRAAGFEPLAPPLREGTTYVVRAIDYRGVPMRVAVDARSGTIRDANRIVSGPGLYGPYVPGPYAPAYYGRLAAPPYPASNDIEAGYLRPPLGTSELPTGDRHGLVPLPRPRPASLAVANDNKSVARPDVAISAPAATQFERSREPGSVVVGPPIND